MDLYFLTLVPLILFVVVDLVWGMKAGIITACVMAVLLLLYFYGKTGQWDEFIVGETILILVLGGVSIKMRNSRYFKFQPVVLGIIFASVASWYQIFDEPILIKFIPTMIALVPQLEDQLTSPLVVKQFTSMSLIFIFLLLIHAALVTWVVLKKGNLSWIFARLAIYPMVLLAPIIQRLFFS